MSPRPTRILLANSVILNGGDAAIVEGTLAFLRSFGRPVDLRIQCHQSPIAKRHYPDLPLYPALAEASRAELPRFFWRFPEKLRYRAWATNPLRSSFTPWVSGAERAALNDLDWADLVISVGGSYLTDVYDYERMLMAPEIAHRLDKPVILLGASLGPFYDPGRLKRFGRQLQLFDLIVARDRKSRDLALELGCERSRCFVGSDLAFALPRPAAARGLRPGPIRIGVSLRRWSFPDAEDADEAYARYLARMAEALDMLVERQGAEIRMLSTCQGIAEYGYHDDEVAAAVRDRMRHKEAVTLDGAFRHPAALAEALAQCDAVIGTRMHACILALLSARPTINIAYEFKSRELFSGFDLEDYVISIADVGPELLHAKVTELRANYDAIQGRIDRHVGDSRSRLDLVGEHLSDYLT